MSDQIYLNSSGFYFRINVSEDISSADTVQMEFTNPDGVLTIKAATVPGVIHEGFAAGEYAEYLVEDGLLDSTGLWNVRIRVVVSSPASSRPSALIPLPITA